MEKLVRLSMSIEKSLFQKLEQMTVAAGYENRSEFLRDLIREKIVDEQWKKSDDCVVGTISLVYGHERHELLEKLTEVQHHHHALVLASTHVHLSEEICAEMIMVKGTPKEVTHLADSLRRQRGVLHAGLIMGTTGVNL